MTTASFSLQILKKEEAIPWPGTLAIVHSYIAYKEGDGLFSSLKHLLGSMFNSELKFCFIVLCCSERRGETEADEMEF